MKKTLLLFVSVMTVILLVLLCTSCGDKDPAPLDTSAPVSSAPSDTSGLSSNGDDTRSAPETGKAPSADSETVPDTVTTEPADTSEPLPDGEVTVVNCVEYKKQVIPTEMSIEIGWDATGYFHVINVPMITSETENAVKFNEKLYSEFGDYLDVLKSNEEGDLIVSKIYDFKIKDGAVAIIGTFSFAGQCAGVGIEYRGYYYDTVEDRELSLDEYIEKCGVDREKIFGELEVQKEFSEFYTEYLNNSEGEKLSGDNIICYAADGEGSVVCIRDEKEFLYNTDFRFDLISGD
ncbi:MAG: hypothetical protein IJR90_06240 [Clostridia bacterium]|nr:hypothetical protein [Clostridia bacterium]